MAMAKQILIKPIITEKAETLSEKRNQYSFKVDKGSNKVEIAKAVESMFNVNVKSVNTVITPGKIKIKGTRSGYRKGVLSPYKKAIVTVEAGQKIDLYADI